MPDSLLLLLAGWAGLLAVLALVKSWEDRRADRVRRELWPDDRRDDW